jgi:hypothetical protein
VDERFGDRVQFRRPRSRRRRIREKWARRERNWRYDPGTLTVWPGGRRLGCHPALFGRLMRVIAEAWSPTHHRNGWPRSVTAIGIPIVMS